VSYAIWTAWYISLILTCQRSIKKEHDFHSVKCLLLHF
jgi:hypothetical protein